VIQREYSPCCVAAAEPGVSCCCGLRWLEPQDKLEKQNSSDKPQIRGVHKKPGSSCRQVYMHARASSGLRKISEEITMSKPCSSECCEATCFSEWGLPTWPLSVEVSILIDNHQPATYNIAWQPSGWLWCHVHDVDHDQLKLPMIFGRQCPQIFPWEQGSLAEAYQACLNLNPGRRQFAQE